MRRTQRGGWILDGIGDLMEIGCWLILGVVFVIIGIPLIGAYLLSGWSTSVLSGNDDHLMCIISANCWNGVMQVALGFPQRMWLAITSGELTTYPNLNLVLAVVSELLYFGLVVSLAVLGYRKLKFDDEDFLDTMIPWWIRPRKAQGRVERNFRFVLYWGVLVLLTGPMITHVADWMLKTR